MSNKKRYGDARDHGWISVYIKEDDSIDGYAIFAIKANIRDMWESIPDGERTIRRLARELGEPFDRIRRLIHRLPGLADELGFHLDSKNHLTIQNY